MIGNIVCLFSKTLLKCSKFHFLSFLTRRGKSVLGCNKFWWLIIKIYFSESNKLLFGCKENIIIQLQASVSLC